MTDRERQMIEGYLPNPPDPELEDGAYYWLQYLANGSTRVLTVYPLDILPVKDGTEYGIYQMRGGRMHRVDAGYDDPCRGVRMHDLYDNKQDCRDQTHMCWDRWEELRQIQQKEDNVHVLEKDEG